MIYIIRSIGVRSLHDLEVINHHKNITQEDLDGYYNYPGKVLVKDVNRIKWIDRWSNSYSDDSRPINIITYNDAVSGKLSMYQDTNDKTELIEKLINDYKIKIRNSKIEEFIQDGNLDQAN